MVDSITVVIPFDWVASVLVPVLSVTVSAAIALWIMSRERIRAENAAIRAQAAELIRALAAVSRAYAFEDADLMNAALLRAGQEINALAALLRTRDIAVAKFVSIVLSQAIEELPDRMPRTADWLAAAVELWVRKKLSTTQFKKSMPSAPDRWIEQIDLGDRQAVIKGDSAIGISDFSPIGFKFVGAPKVNDGH